MAITVQAINEVSPLGATPLDDVSDLIPQYITTRQELFNAEFSNISIATQRYTTSTITALITMSWLLRLHKDMFGAVWK